MAPLQYLENKGAKHKHVSISWKIQEAEKFIALKLLARCNLTSLGKLKPWMI